MNTFLWVLFIIYGIVTTVIFFVLLLINKEGGFPYGNSKKVEYIKLTTRQLVIAALTSPIWFLVGVAIGEDEGDTILDFFIGKK